MDTGFIVWSFQGRQLYRNPVVIDKFCQLLWRPRPPTLLTDEHIKVTSISVFVFVFVCACVCVCVCVCMHVAVHMCACVVHIYVYACICVCTMY